MTSTIMISMVFMMTMMFITWNSNGGIMVNSFSASISIYRSSSSRVRSRLANTRNDNDEPDEKEDVIESTKQFYDEFVDEYIQNVNRAGVTHAPEDHMNSFVNHVIEQQHKSAMVLEKQEPLLNNSPSEEEPISDEEEEIVNSETLEASEFTETQPVDGSVTESSTKNKKVPTYLYNGDTHRAEELFDSDENLRKKMSHKPLFQPFENISSSPFPLKETEGELSKIMEPENLPPDSSGGIISEKKNPSTKVPTYLYSGDTHRAEELFDNDENLRKKMSHKPLFRPFENISSESLPKSSPAPPSSPVSETDSDDEQKKGTVLEEDKPSSPKVPTYVYNGETHKVEEIFDDDENLRKKMSHKPAFKVFENISSDESLLKESSVSQESISSSFPSETPKISEPRTSYSIKTDVPSFVDTDDTNPSMSFGETHRVEEIFDSDDKFRQRMSRKPAFRVFENISSLITPKKGEEITPKPKNKTVSPSDETFRVEEIFDSQDNVKEKLSRKPPFRPINSIETAPSSTAASPPYSSDKRQRPKILELGCGYGRDAAKLSSAGMSVIATDFSQSMLLKAQEYLSKRSITTGPDRQDVVQLLKLDMRQIGQIFLPNYFQGIYACASVLHIPKSDVNKLFQDMYNVLAPGGILYISVKMSDEPEESFDPDSRYGIKKFYSFYSSNEFESLFLENGFSILENGIEDHREYDSYATHPFIHVIAQKPV